MVNMAGGAPTPSNFFDYVGPSAPQGAEEAETWYDTDDDQAYVYTSSSGWTQTNVVSHDALTGVTDSQHHNPVTKGTSQPFTIDAGQVINFSWGNGLVVNNGSLQAYLSGDLDFDADGKIRIPAGSVTESMLAFSTATQSELNSHANSTSNPHSVTASQVGSYTQTQVDSGFVSESEGAELPQYTSTSNVPTGITEGELVYVTGDGLYVEDGT